MQGVNNVHLEMERFTRLQGITGMVQGMPHGAMALGTSKVGVPIGEFLEDTNGEPSPPVLGATPTPCTPTSLDQAGRVLGLIAGGYVVSVLSTPNIASDLSATVWDASSFGESPLPMSRDGTCWLAHDANAVTHCDHRSQQAHGSTHGE